MPLHSFHTQFQLNHIFSWNTIKIQKLPLKEPFLVKHMVLPLIFTNKTHMYVLLTFRNFENSTTRNTSLLYLLHFNFQIDSYCFSYISYLLLLYLWNFISFILILSKKNCFLQRIKYHQESKKKEGEYYAFYLIAMLYAIQCTILFKYLKNVV